MFVVILMDVDTLKSEIGAHVMRPMILVRMMIMMMSEVEMKSGMASGSHHQHVVLWVFSLGNFAGPSSFSCFF